MDVKEHEKALAQTVLEVRTAVLEFRAVDWEELAMGGVTMAKNITTSGDKRQ